jgi:ankyrin repeat protein
MDGSSLHQAAISGEMGKVSAILMQNPGLISFTNQQGWTALHQAARMGRKDVVTLLLAKGAQADAKDKDGNTPMDLAAICGDEELVELLRKHSPRDLRGAIREAARRGDVTGLKALIKRDPNLVHIKDNNSDTGRTPLLWAAWEGQAECLRVLVSAGADIKSTEEWRGWTALISAAKKGNDLSGGNLAYGDHLSCVKQLISAGADVNKPDRPGNTPLLTALLYGRIDCAMALIAAGANVNAKLKDGSTPLWHAVQHNAPDCVQALLLAGADPNVWHTGCSPLELAQKRQYHEIVELMVDEKSRREKQALDARMRAEAEKVERRKREEQAEAERLRAETERVRIVQQQRKSLKKCVMCGRPLSFVNRVMRQDRHGASKQFCD